MSLSLMLLLLCCLLLLVLLPLNLIEATEG
jgi:hypothetical protein